MAFAATSCVKVEKEEIAQLPEPTPMPTPSPTPAPTPHPAAGARAQAVILYPALAQPNSIFNRTFLDLMEQEQKQRPWRLTKVDWPLSLAYEVASMLGVQPQQAVAVTPPPRPEPTPHFIIITPAPRRGTMLDGGAYDKKTGVTGTPVLRYYYVP